MNSPDQRLIYAAYRGDIEEARQAFRDGASIDAEEGSATALSWACRYGREQMAAHLLGLGASVDKANWHGSTPLHEAARQGRREVAILLMENGADRQAKDNAGRSPCDVEAAGTGIDWQHLTPQARKLLKTPVPKLRPLLLPGGKPARVLLELLGAHRLADLLTSAKTPDSADQALALEKSIRQALTGSKACPLLMKRFTETVTHPIARHLQRSEALRGHGF